MALRFQCKGAQVAQAGTVFNHNLGVVPDEFGAFLAGPVPGGTGLYRTALPTTSQITFAAIGATTTGDIFVASNHSIIK